jgi:cell division transport system ATP-binding protein
VALGTDAESANGVTLPPRDGPAIAADDVGFAYGQIIALRQVSFSLAGGEFAYLVGPSAAGKTTLLRMIHGQLRPQTGSLVVNAVEVNRAGSAQLRRLRREVGVVFQDYKLLERLTAAENVAYALRVADLTLAPREAERRASAALRQVGLGGRLGAYPRELSGGQQQRLAIARALAARPFVLLADEPTASLDEANAEKVVELLQRISLNGTTVLVATHDSSMVKESRCCVLTLERGYLRADRYHDPANPDQRLRVAWAAK